MESPGTRYEFARSAFSRLKGHLLASEPLERWSLPSDRHLPSALIVLPLHEVLEKPYSVLLGTKGVGESKLEKLIVLIERALADLSETNEPTDFNGVPGEYVQACEQDRYRPVIPTPKVGVITLDDITFPVWKRICECIKMHSLEHYPLGRFAESLDDLPRGLWSCPLSDFVDHRFDELGRLDGYGEQRIKSVVNVLATTAKLVSDCPANTHLGIKVFPARIEKITSWISRVLYDDRLPDYSSLCQHFVLPLLQQLECDLGSQTAEMIERRLGVENEPETLQQIADSFGLTRERIRQVTCRAPDVMDVRWPEGKHLLDDFFEKFHRSGEATRHVDMIQRTLGLLFNVQTRGGVSREQVIQAWNGAGQYKETPMSENEMLVWLGGNFPKLVPAEGVKWITSESLSVEYGGRQLYFSNDEPDQLLHRLYQSGHATPVNDLVDVDEREQRNLRTKLQRDLRFTEDEDHCFLPTELLGFTRDSVGWHINLEQAKPGRRLTRTFVSVDSIVDVALSSFLRMQIVDVTVWGFHRYVDELLGQLYEARLPDSITPFVLSDTVVRQSGKRIRPMRRRRLRWDSDANASMVARGKRGWVGFVVQTFGVPIMIDELRNMLSEFYQDYDTYVIEQLNLDGDEEGVSNFGITLHPGIAHKIPSIIVPEGWSLDTSSDNVSEGVKLSITRAIALLQENRITLTDLGHLPWFIELIERHSYGAKFPQYSRERSSPKAELEQTLFSFNGLDAAQSEPFARNGSVASATPQKNVDDLLQRFL